MVLPENGRGRKTSPVVVAVPRLYTSVFEPRIKSVSSFAGFPQADRASLFVREKSHFRRSLSKPTYPASRYSKARRR